MEESKTRYMHPDDWRRVEIPRGMYFNKEHILTGYESVDGQGGNPLHPVCVFEDRLRKTHQTFRGTYPDISLSRWHIKMPHWEQAEQHLPNNYAFVKAPERLTTTSVTVVLVSQDQIKEAQMGFYYDGQTLLTLRERMKDVRFQGLAGNLGYYMTEGLIKDKLPWSHNVRYPEFPLPTILSYLGFYLFKDEGTGAIYSSFQGAHPAAVGIRKSGAVEIIPKLAINQYKVTLWGEEFLVNSINNPQAIDDVMLFTPGLWTPEWSEHIENWQTFAPEIPVPDRVNVFIANEGDGQKPLETVLQLWKGRAPIPSFGAVLSFARERFEKLFARAQSISFLDERVSIEPLAGTDIENFGQILGGMIPAVVEGQHLYCAQTVQQVKEQLHAYGNALSPLAECGRESRNFDLRIREPAGLLVETEDQHIGWVLFDGRHELSIGASVVDVAKILRLLEDKGLFKVKHALFIDGGSAMKTYAITSEGQEIKLDLLNRVAAGGRNGPGADPDGLNLYTLLKLGLCGTQR